MNRLWFGRWEVLSAEGRKWICRCTCGNEKAVDRYSLANGVSTSCGCLRTALLAERRTTHGLSKTPEYRIWAAMLDRCRNPFAQDWPNYGERGIRVAGRWGTFERFLADMGPRPHGGRYTLERRDNSKGYSPSNCYWATYSEQARNKRTTLRLGEASLLNLAEAAGLTGTAVRSRRARGKPDSDLLLADSKAIRRAQAKRESTGLLARVNGQMLTLKELSEASGVHYNTLRYRHKQGLPLLGEGSAAIPA